MNRNLKIVGLALVAVLAMSAWATASASAFTKFASVGNVNVAVTADQEASAQHVFTVDSATVKCTTAHFATMGEVTSPAATIEVHPEYSGCTAFGFVNASVETKGCDYVLHASGTVDIVQGAGTETCNRILVHGGTCTVEIKPIAANTGLGTASYENLTGGKVKILANVSGITVNKTEDGVLCPLSGTGPGTGTYKGNTIASGTHLGSAVGIKVE